MNRTTSEHVALRTASRIARRDSDLARLEAERPGHGAAELARRVKDACPEVSKAAARRAADTVLAARLERREYRGVVSRESCGRATTVNPPATRLTPSRALGRTPKPVPTLAERLDAYRIAEITHAFRAGDFRQTDGPGGLDLRVTLTDGVEPVRATSEMVRTSERYSSRSTWYVSEQWVRIAAHRRWISRVRDAGLDTERGILVLGAEPLPTTGDVGVYRATWARQGRGISLVTERGFIARHTPSGTLYHATDSDPEKALAGLRRKLRAQAVPAAERDAARAERAARKAARQAAGLARLLDRLARWDLAEIEHVEVTRADSLRAHNCVPGTDAFIDRYGFDGRESATVGEIARAVGMRDVASLTGADLKLARHICAAVLVAVRRDRQVARRLQLA